MTAGLALAAPLAALGVAAGLVWLVAGVRAALELRALPALRGEEARPAREAVAMYVPARDEGARIEACLASLRGQRGVVGCVTVVDDHSSDDTAARVAARAAADDGVWLVRAPELPPGVCGKPHALAHAVAAERQARRAGAESPWMLFVDADTRLHPDTVAAALARAEARGFDVVTLLPRVEVDGFWGRLVGPSVGALVLGRTRPTRVADAGAAEAFANGQFLLVRRGAYAAAGGHAAVAAEVLEDTALARRLKAAGARIAVLPAPALVATTMYGTLGELWAGWSKNLFALLGGRVVAGVATAAAAVALAWLPPLGAIAGAWTLGEAGAPEAAGGRALAAAALASYAGVVALQARLRAIGGAWPRYAPLAPLGALITAALVLSATYAGRTGRRVAWKGRALRAAR